MRVFAHFLLSSFYYSTQNPYLEFEIFAPENEKPTDQFFSGGGF